MAVTSTADFGDRTRRGERSAHRSSDRC